MIAAAILLSGLLLTPGEELAIDCRPAHPIELLRWSDFAFVGRVLRSDERQSEYQVLRRFRWDAGGRSATVRVQGGRRRRVGDQVVVFARPREGRPELVFSACVGPFDVREPQGRLNLSFLERAASGGPHNGVMVDVGREDGVFDLELLETGHRRRLALQRIGVGIWSIEDIPAAVYEVVCRDARRKTVPWGAFRVPADSFIRLYVATTAR